MRLRTTDCGEGARAWVDDCTIEVPDTGICLGSVGRSQGSEGNIWLSGLEAREREARGLEGLSEGWDLG